MPKRSSKPKDVNNLAWAIVDEATSAAAAQRRTKNPAAVALGRLGGLKGGRARAEKLSKSRRSQIAKAAARKRWDAARAKNQK